MCAMRQQGLPNSRPPGERLLILRLVFGLLLAAGLISFAIYVATGNSVWRQRGLIIVKWTVIAGLGAAAILVLEELAVLL
jgi:hypothetical protein